MVLRRRGTLASACVSLAGLDLDATNNALIMVISMILLAFVSVITRVDTGVSSAMYPAAPATVILIPSAVCCKVNLAAVMVIVTVPTLHVLVTQAGAVLVVRPLIALETPIATIAVFATDLSLHQFALIALLDGWDLLVTNPVSTALKSQ